MRSAVAVPRVVPTPLRNRSHRVPRAHARSSNPGGSPLAPSRPSARRIADATTRAMSSRRVRLDPAHHLLAPGQVVTSPESRVRFGIERLLGVGGFVQVYRARRLSQSSTVAATVCIKISARIDGWLREAYFGQLLEGHP